MSDSTFNISERVGAALDELLILDRRVAVGVIVHGASDYELRRLVAWAGERLRMGVWSVQQRQRLRIEEALERARVVLRAHGLTEDHVRCAYAPSTADQSDAGVDDRPGTCAVCGTDLPRRLGRGRPAVYCSHACRERAWRRSRG